MNIFKKETMQNPLLQKLEVLLKGHDWHYMRSDDHRWYKSGRAESERIQECIEECNNSDLGTDAIEMYRKYNPSYNEQ
tara:strand:- start:187 stop:420 length:234 start_codon:yes stop_codon:yes gene_type:complete